MNTLVRAVASQPIIGRFSLISVNTAPVWLVLLFAALFFSAFGIVYVKDMSRRYYIQAQTIERQNSLSTERWSKLLLERSTLTTQSRVERIAHKRLDMVLPSNKKIQLITSLRTKEQGR